MELPAVAKEQQQHIDAGLLLTHVPNNAYISQRWFDLSKVRDNKAELDAILLASTSTILSSDTASSQNTTNSVFGKAAVVCMSGNRIDKMDGKVMKTICGVECSLSRVILCGNSRTYEMFNSKVGSNYTDHLLSSYIRDCDSGIVVAKIVYYINREALCSGSERKKVKLSDVAKDSAEALKIIQDPMIDKTYPGFWNEMIVGCCTVYVPVEKDNTKIAPWDGEDGRTCGGSKDWIKIGEIVPPVVTGVPVEKGCTYRHPDGQRVLAVVNKITPNASNVSKSDATTGSVDAAHAVAVVADGGMDEESREEIFTIRTAATPANATFVDILTGDNVLTKWINGEFVPADRNIVL